MIKRILLFFGLVILCSFLGTAQTSMLFYLKITDDSGGHDSLIFGNHELATFGLDLALGEYPYVGPPPGVFQTKFTCPRSPAPADWGVGILHKDLRDTNNATTRKDSFYVWIINDAVGSESANLTLKWPDAAWITARCDSMKLVIPFDTVLPTTGINMASTDTLVIPKPYDVTGWNPSAPVLQLRIFKWGLHQPNIDAVRKENQLIPSSFSLEQNFPEPFNPQTTIRFSLPHETHVTLKVFNFLGQEVQTLVNDTRTAGSYSVDFDASNLSSGMYFYTLHTRRFLQTKKMLVIR
jgi:hypothetical protein